MQIKTGKFIVIDGGEGAGKSTQILKLKEFFGDKVIVTREPGGSPYATEIRKIILDSDNAKQADARTHFGLFWAARADHLKNTIRPALVNGISVLCDRFDSSTFAYQVYGQQAEELPMFFWKMRKFYLNGTIPNLYIYMDVDVKTGLARKKTQGPEEINHFDERQVDFHERMREGMKEFFKHVPHCEVVDANLPEEVVFDNLVTLLTKELKSVD